MSICKICDHYHDEDGELCYPCQCSDRDKKRIAELEQELGNAREMQLSIDELTSQLATLKELVRELIDLWNLNEPYEVLAGPITKLAAAVKED